MSVNLGKLVNIKVPMSCLEMFHLMGFQAGTNKMDITGPPVDTGPILYLTGTEPLNIKKLPLNPGFFTP